MRLDSEMRHLKKSNQKCNNALIQVPITTRGKCPCFTCRNVLRNPLIIGLQGVTQYHASIHLLLRDASKFSTKWRKLRKELKNNKYNNTMGLVTGLTKVRNSASFCIVATLNKTVGNSIISLGKDLSFSLHVASNYFMVRCMFFTYIQYE